MTTSATKKILLNTFKILLGLVFASIGIYILLRDVNLVNLKNSLLSVSPISILGASVFATLMLVFRSLRWKLILPDIENSNKSHLFSAATIGFMINNLFPARIGEVARVYLLWKNNKYSAPVAFGNLILERVLDTLVIFLMFFIPIFTKNELSSLLPWGIFTLLIFIGTILFFILYAFFPKQIVKPIHFAFSLLPEKISHKLSLMFDEVTLNLSWLHSIKKVTLVIIYSILTMATYPIMILLISKNPGTSFGFIEASFAQAAAAFGSAIPLAPGYVGTVHAAMYSAVAMFNYNPDSARALTILYHAINYIIITLLGLFFYFTMSNVSLKDISKFNEEQSKKDE